MGTMMGRSDGETAGGFVWRSSVSPSPRHPFFRLVFLKQAYLIIFLGFMAIRKPSKLIEIAFPTRAKNDPLGLEQLLLQIKRYCQPPGRAFSLRINNPLPWHAFIGAMHDITDCAGRVAFAKDDRKLTVCHHPAGGDLADDLINAFSIILVAGPIHTIWAPPRRGARIKYRRIIGS